MTNDIVTRLRDWHTEWDWYLPDQAADEIERWRLACHFLAGWLSFYGIDGKEAVEIAYEKAVTYE